MKKQKAINSDLVAYLQAMLAYCRPIADMFMEGSWLCAVLDNGLKVKIKQKN